MDFTVFDTTKMDEYAERAKKQWGQTDAYKEYEKKLSSTSLEKEQDAYKNLMLIFVEFGSLKEKPANALEVQNLVKHLQNYISEHFYQCTNTILSELGFLYASGGEFTENIDYAAGKGTAGFVAEAIEVYCGQG